MKLFEDWIAESLFTKEELTKIKQIYSDSTTEYLKSLDTDPFSHDYTAEDIQTYIQDTLNEKGVQASENDLKQLTNIIRHYAI